MMSVGNKRKNFNPRNINVFNEAPYCNLSRQRRKSVSEVYEFGIPLVKSKNVEKRTDSKKSFQDERLKKDDRAQSISSAIGYIKEYEPLLRIGISLYVYNGKYFQDITEKNVAISYIKTILNEECNRIYTDYNEMYRQLLTEPDICIDSNLIEENEDALIFRNGTYYISRDEFKENYFCPEDYAFSMIDEEYSSSCDTGEREVDEFVNSFCNDNQDRVKLFWQLLGVMISNYSPKQSIYYFMGAPDAGKSTVCRFVESVIGSRLYRAISIRDLTSDYVTSEFIGARIVADEDVAVNVVLKAKEIEALKKITSSDMIRTRAIYNSAVYTKLRCKFLLAGNGRLKISGKEDVQPIINRLVIFPLEKSVPRYEQDPYIISKLIKGRKYAVRRALQGVREWLEDGQAFSEVCSAEICFSAEIHADGIAGFVNTKCKLGNLEMCTISEIYEEYLYYCDGDLLIRPLSKILFTRFLKENYNICSDRTNDQRLLRGISIADKNGKTN